VGRGSRGAGFAITIPEFLDNLSAIVCRSVIDKTSTGFKETFDVDLKFDPCAWPVRLGETGFRPR
jgi:hypothetical protein